MTYGVIIGERGDAARWKNERRRFRRGPGTPYRKLLTLRHLLTRDRVAVARWLGAPGALSRRRRLLLLREFLRIQNALRGYHTLTELLHVAEHAARLAGRPGLVMVEVGAGSGASTAKLSLLARAVGAELFVFDTFRGIPENEEQHELLDGTPIRFVKGAFRGRLGAVRRRVAELGAPEVCHFEKGLVQDTLPRFDRDVDLVLSDVDLVSSTRVVVRELYPRLRAGGALFSQDGHLRATRALLDDPAFWTDEVRRPRPPVDALAGGKLLRIRA